MRLRVSSGSRRYGIANKEFICMLVLVDARCAYFVVLRAYSECKLDRSFLLRIPVLVRSWARLIPHRRTHRQAYLYHRQKLLRTTLGLYFARLLASQFNMKKTFPYLEMRLLVMTGIGRTGWPSLGCCVELWAKLFARPAHTKMLRRFSTAGTASYSRLLVRL
jgi:hypothetical protein